MASLISKTDKAGEWQGRIASHIDLTAYLAERRTKLGNPEMPRNARNRRTDSNGR